MFERECPFYLSIGMTYDMYWNGDPRIVKYYKEANELNIKRKNQELWMQGLYVYDAIATALSNIHFDNKFHKPNKYLEKPYDLFPKQEQEKKEEVEKAKSSVIAQLNAFKAKWEKKGQSNG